jgi:hypothetical protein
MKPDTTHQFRLGSISSPDHSIGFAHPNTLLQFVPEIYALKKERWSTI